MEKIIHIFHKLNADFTKDRILIRNILAKYYIDQDIKRAKGYLLQNFSIAENIIEYEIGKYLENTNQEYAISWYKLAAAKKNRKALLKLSKYVSTVDEATKMIKSAEEYRPLEFIKNLVIGIDDLTLNNEIRKIKTILHTDLLDMIFKYVLACDQVEKEQILELLVELNYIFAIRLVAANHDAKKNTEQQIAVLLKAVNLGDIYAELKLGQIYMNSGDIQQALEWYQKAIENDGKHNDPKEVNSIKKIVYDSLAEYYFGIRDDEKSFKYAELADNKLILAKCYATGRGIEQNKDKAVNLLTDASLCITLEPMMKDLIDYYELKFK